MAVSLYERDIYILKFGVNQYPKSAPAIPIYDIIESITRLKDKGRAFSFLDEKGYPSLGVEDEGNYDPLNAIYIADYEYDEKNLKFTVLINRGDPNIAASTFLNLETGTIREAQREDGETIGHSAHMVIDLNPNNMVGSFYKCYLERMPTVSRSIIKVFLNRILENDFKNRGVQYRNARNKDVDMRPVLKIEGYMSDNLARDLEQGHITMLEFTKTDDNFEGVDLYDRSTVVKHKVQVKLTKDRDNTNFIDRMRREAHASGYEELQVHIHGLNGDRSVSPRFRTATEDAADLLYMRIETIDNFEAELIQCISEINDEIKNKMIALG